MTTNFFNLSLLLLFLDQGSGMDKNQDPLSGINIPDPQHWIIHIFVFFKREDAEALRQAGRAAIAAAGGRPPSHPAGPPCSRTAGAAAAALQYFVKNESTSSAQEC